MAQRAEKTRVSAIVLPWVVAACCVASTMDSPGVLPVEDRVFIIDGSGSILGPEFTYQLDIIREVLCGSGAPDYARAPLGVAIVQFAAVATVEVPYTVIDSPQSAADLCSTLDLIIATRGNSLLAPALEEALDIFAIDALAPARGVFLMTDGDLDDDVFALEAAAELRGSVPPVRLCASHVTDACEPTEPLLMRLVNDPRSDYFMPDEPEGVYSCTDLLTFPDLACLDCACGTDCNANGVLDAVDIATGASLDANEDRLPDECTDCNGNGVFDAVEIAGDPFLDCDANGFLDGCEIADGSAVDCNANGLPDSCDIAGGSSPDCNTNGVPSECDVRRPVALASPRLHDVGFGSPVAHTFAIPHSPAGDVTLRVRAELVKSFSSDALDLSLDGFFVGQVFQSAPVSCEFSPESGTDQLIVGRNEFLAVAVDGSVQVLLSTIDGILTSGCPDGTWVEVDVLYDYVPVIDGIRFATDCDLARGDSNLDGVVDIDDFLALLGIWGPCADPANCPADADGSGAVDIDDFLNLLGNWGPA